MLCLAVAAVAGCKRVDPPYAMVGINANAKAERIKDGPSDDEIQCRREAEVQGEFVDRKQRYAIVLAAYRDCLVQHGIRR